MATKSEKLQDLLSSLRQNAGDIEASAIVSNEGLIIAADLPRDVAKEKVAAMSAAMLSIGKRAAQELSRGRLNQIFLEGTEGSNVLMAAGEKALLVGLARPDSNLGLVFLEMRQTAENVSEVM